MLIKKLEIKFGSSGVSNPLLLDEPTLTVFVGPNNSGKSQMLRDVRSWCQQGKSVGLRMINDLQFEAFSNDDAEEFEASIRARPNLGEHVRQGWQVYSINGNRFNVPTTQLHQVLVNPNTPATSPQFANNYARHFTLNLDGVSRIGLLNPQTRGDLKNPQQPFAKLLCDDSIRKRVRATIYDALGLYIGVDMSEGDKLQVRFGDTPPPDERTVRDDILAWMSSANPIEQVSDGVKAFSGILIQLAVGAPKVFLIDEPEAFLHPALAYKLGKEIGKSSVSDGKQTFVATHSPQFLMGAIQSGAKVNIIRLTYSGGVGTARLLPVQQVQKLMRDPILRSANVLAGLFHEHVIVTEADTDRAFYQEVNDRLVDSSNSRGIPNALFINANGKDQLHRIAKPLRALGVPVAVVADIDVLNQGGVVWTNHLDACNVPASQHQPFGTMRASIWNSLVSSGGEPKVDGGIELLRGSDKEAAENLLRQLAEYGFFVVPCGELERWLAELKVSRSKHTWLREIFGAMGDEPTSPDYVVPDDDDVWSFMDGIRSWVTDPNRRGIPS